MVITASSVYRGPSIYASRPVVRQRLALSSPGVERFDPDRIDDLFDLLPGLRNHRDLCGAPAALTRPGASRVAHLFEHVCIELQNLTGAELHCVRGNGGPRIGEDEAVVPFDDEEIGAEAGKLAVELIDPLLRGAAGPIPSRADFRARLETFLERAERRTLPVQDRALLQAAAARDIPVTRIAGRLVQLGHGPFQKRLNGTKTSHTDVVSNQLAANKDYTRRLLASLGLPVAAYERVYRSQDAVEAARRIGFPVVVKPNAGKMGGGVSVGLATDREVRSAYKRARAFGRSVIVEQLVRGSDFRLLVIDGELVAASMRVPAHVRGNGEHTIEQLVRRANEDPRRGAGQHHSWTRLELDEEADRVLAQAGHERASVPGEGEVVFLRRNANTSSGGTAVDVTDRVHPENRSVAERTARAIGLDVAGVDILTPDIGRPIREVGGVVCEVNSRPGLRKHLWPAEGEPRDVLGPILDMLFPPGRSCRIPIVAVTGTGDTLAVARQLSHLLAGNDLRVALDSRDGFFLDGRRLGGPTPEPRAFLLDPAVEAAVVEVAPGDVLDRGLGWDACDVCVVVESETGDRRRTEEAILLVARSARRAVVLRPDRAVHLAPHVRAPVWHAIVDGTAPEATPRRVTIDRSAEGISIRLEEGGRAVARIPVAGEGDCENTLLAVAGALSLGRSPTEVADRLRAE